MTFYAKRLPWQGPENTRANDWAFLSAAAPALAFHARSALRPTCRSCRLWPWPAGTLMAPTAVLHMRSWPQPAHGTWKQKPAASYTVHLHPPLHLAHTKQLKQGIYTDSIHHYIWHTQNSSNRGFTLIPSTIIFGTQNSPNREFTLISSRWTMKKARRRHIFYECKIIIASTIAVWLSCTSTTQKHQHSDILQLSQVHQRNLIIVRHIEPPQLLEWLANRALLTYPNQPITLIILRQSEAQRINNKSQTTSPETIRPSTDMLCVDKAHRSWQA